MREQLDRLYDRLLVLRCQTGDPAAFEELVRRYQPRLRRFLRRMLDDDEHLAEDVLQDVWFDVFRGVGKLEDLDAFAGWLWRVARNRAYRALRRRAVVATEAIDEMEVAGDEEPATIDSAEQKQVLDASLVRLSPEQREVLLLRYIEELSYEQIAAAVGCGLGTVRSRLHYAKAALRSQMERNDEP
jgi:RNA polymerase sigma-70 factor (ECF subfamily)